MKMKNRGFTLVEIILVLAVTVLIIVSSLYVYNKVKIYLAAKSIVDETISVNNQYETLRNKVGYAGTEKLAEYIDNNCVDYTGQGIENYNQKCFKDIGIDYTPRSNFMSSYLQLHTGSNGGGVQIRGVKSSELCIAIMTKLFAASREDQYVQLFLGGGEMSWSKKFTGTENGDMANLNAMGRLSTYCAYFDQGSDQSAEYQPRIVIYQ